MIRIAETSTVPQRHGTRHPAVRDRYADLTDLPLARALSTEDAAEESGHNPLERTTCYTHRRWLHQCVSSPLHVIVVTGRRWCRRCECAVTVAVDELVGDLTLTCPRCGEMPAGAANRQILRSCRPAWPPQPTPASPAADPPPRGGTVTEAKHWTIDIYVDEHEDRTRARVRLHNRDETGLVGVGLARLNPTDRNIPEIGDELAVARALADLAHQLLEATAADIEAVTHQPTSLTR